MEVSARLCNVRMRSACLDDKLMVYENSMYEMCMMVIQNCHNWLYVQYYLL